jgi:Zn-dependent protease with chaperone function
VAGAPLTFFEHQARARQATTRLVVLFLLAVAGVTVAVNLVVATVYANTVGRYPLPALDALGTLVIVYAGVPVVLYVWTTAITLAIVGLRSLVVVRRLRAGGDAVAAMVGGAPVDRGTPDADARRLLNVVDEMAIASGIAVPRVYLLRGEPGINAFAAGYAPNQAAIAVTEGAMRGLTRDELQGVIGHEFSHVLNGDMRMNVRMIGVLAGILFVGEIGEFLMRSSASRDRRRNANGVVLIGLAMTLIGYVGLVFGRLVKAAVARQREFLADASSVQFTRNPDGLAGALATIGATAEGALVRNRHAETLSHMFFADGIAVWFSSLFATHPPIAERIRRIDPRFVAARYLAARAQRARAEALADTAARDVLPAAATPGAAAARSPAAFGAGAGARVRAGTGPARTPLRRGPRQPGPASAAATAVVASVGMPGARHVEYAAKLLETLPAVIRDAAATAEGAHALVLAFALGPDEAIRKRQLDLLRRAGLETVAQAAERLAAPVRAMGAAYRLPAVELAMPSLRGLAQPTRDAVIRSIETIVADDERVTLEEFVLLTIVRHQLGAGAARNEPVAFRSILEVLEDARLVVSLLAHADADDTQYAFERGFGVLGLDGGQAPPLAQLAFPRIAEALERLRRLAPFPKRTFLTACVETVTADGHIALAEAELLRAVAMELDSPVPPILDRA